MEAPAGAGPWPTSTDGAGSSAVANNAVGIAPTQELVSRDGMIGAGVNTRVGPICRTVEDAARLLTVIAGYDPKDEMTAFGVGRLPDVPYETFASAPARLDGMRIGVVRHDARVAHVHRDEAERELARLNFARLEGLVNEGAISRADYDRVAAELKQSEARVAEIRATIARKTIRAPFSGILGIRQVNLGQYLSGGHPVVPLQSLDPIYVNFGVPQQDIAQLRIDTPVHITMGELPGVEFTGRVTAINSVVDEATRNVQVQATLANPSGSLHPGMFVRAELRLGGDRQVIALPASAINYAPYGDSVFVVTDLGNSNGQIYRGVRQQFVHIEGARGDLVAVLSGLNPGDEVVTSGVFKLRNGAAVHVNNTVQPANSLNPQPEDS